MARHVFDFDMTINFDAMVEFEDSGPTLDELLTEHSLDEVFEAAREAVRAELDAMRTGTTSQSAIVHYVKCSFCGDEHDWNANSGNNSITLRTVEPDGWDPGDEVAICRNCVRELAHETRVLIAAPTTAEALRLNRT